MERQHFIITFSLFPQLLGCSETLPLEVRNNIVWHADLITDFDSVLYLN